jgi:hypothetical protein
VIDSALRALKDTAIATAVRENALLFPWIESVHVLALTLVIGLIAIVDLRLLGLASRERGIADLSRSVLPATWGAFAVAATSGFLLFSSNATTYAHNPYFQAKLVVLALAGINMAAYHFFVEPRSPDTGPASRPARVAGGLSLLFWIIVVMCGRWIGFTITATPP